MYVRSSSFPGESPIEVTDETVEEVLSQCELKLSKLMSMTHLDGGKMASRRANKIDLAYYEEKVRFFCIIMGITQKTFLPDSQPPHNLFHEQYLCLFCATKCATVVHALP